MSTHQVHVFISHSWAYSKHYECLANWVFERSWRSGQASIRFCDFSVPRSDPIHNAPTDRQLREAIYGKIRRSHVVVIPTGMYASYSRWIQKEVEGAIVYGKPILAVNPWGQERKSSVVHASASRYVGWNAKSVAQGIWDLYYV
jgi:hypothetical protein